MSRCRVRSRGGRRQRDATWPPVTTGLDSAPAAPVERRRKRAGRCASRRTATRGTALDVSSPRPRPRKPAERSRDALANLGRAERKTSGGYLG